MPFHPIVPPEPDLPKPGSHLSLTEEDDVARAEVEQLVDSVAANGGGELSSELALDLLLNNIVEQARLATGASGAAIALVRDGKMVCRATAGPTAPDLGIELDTHSGLSGACVSTGQIQLCDDTENDPRVDAAASRQLGARSILIIPLVESVEILGVFEIFSSRAGAFSQRDIHTLQALSRKILQDRDTAAKRLQPTSAPEAAFTEMEKVRAEPVEEELPIIPPWPKAGSEDPGLSGSSWTRSPRRPAWYEADHGRVTALPPKSRKVRSEWIQPTPPPPQLDIASAILTVLVVFAGVALGILAGWRTGVLREYLKESEAARGPVTSQRPASAKKAPNSAKASANTKPESTPKTQMAKNQTGAAGSRGGLVVYEDGKEVYRTRPENAALKEPEPNPSVSGNTPVLEEKVANERLVHRVEPQYSALIASQSEEPIILEITVGADGVVSDATVVSGDPAKAAIALSAVRKWRYEPRGEEVHTGFRTRVTLTPAALRQ